jgi:hypothetical protein
MVRLSRLFVPLVLLVSACATEPPRPDQVAVPVPILNNSGTYMSPYTQDGVLAPWVDKAIKVRMASQGGAMAGSYVAQQALNQIPFIGGFLGDKAGGAVGRAVALQAIGGDEYLKSTSDISFNNMDDLAVYMFAKNSTHPAYGDALTSTMAIYPDLKDGYARAINRAVRQGAGSK